MHSQHGSFEILPIERDRKICVTAQSGLQNHIVIRIPQS